MKEGKGMRKHRTIVTLFLVLLMLAPLQAQLGGRLKINNATYGRNGQGANVTNRVRSMIHNNSLDFKVD